MIRSRLFKGLATLVITFAILSTFISVRLIQNSVVTEAQTRVRDNLNSVWSVADAELHEIQTILELAAGKQLIVDACCDPDWPNQEVQNRLELIRMKFGLDFLTLISPQGQVVIRTAPPYTTGDFRLSRHNILKALEGETIVSRELMSREELDREHQGLAERAYIVLEETPHARPTRETVETRGLVKMGVVPIQKGNQIVGAIYGGILLNKNNDHVDRIANAVFKNENHKDDKQEKFDPSNGTVTIFLHDSRIATTVRLPNGNRALGTRVSKEVAERVLDNGKRWEGRAFVVNDWYLTAYDPIWDSEGKVIGMLYVGILEQPFKNLVKNIIFRYVILSVFGLAIAVGLAFYLAGRLAEPLHRLAEAAKSMHRGQRPDPVTFQNASSETRELMAAFNEMAETLTEREGKLKETNLKLEDTNNSLNVLNRSYMETLGFISHELKSPLATIMNYVYLIQQEKIGTLSEKQRKAIRNIDSNVKLIVEMVRHYLNLSRIENGELEPVVSRVEVLKEVLAPLVESAEIAAEARQMTIENRVSPDVIIHADLNMMREVFENLISNAVKYGREGGVVKITSQEQGDFIRFGVFNEGEGISSEHLATLFQKFSRLENDKAARKQKGTGLGLFISKHIVDAHGGTIYAESQEGEWVEFIFTVPRYTDVDGEHAAAEE